MCVFEDGVRGESGKLCDSLTVEGVGGAVGRYEISPGVCLSFGFVEGVS